MTIRKVPKGFACLVFVCALGCSRSALKVQKFADGTRELTCDYPLWKCIAQVDDYCKGASFEVLYALDDQHRYGAPGQEVESRTSRAVVHCLGLHDGPALPAGTPLAPASALQPVRLPPPSRPPAPAPRPAPPRACVAGATQVCVGPGACSGGQSCLPDGSGFGACDCGAPKASAPAGTAPAPAP
ncbi:MAG TPA: hypothetical protein VGK73_22440 [Polyangiaceae bacterium]